VVLFLSTLLQFFQVWRYAITIHLFGELPLQVDLSSIHAIFYVSRVHSQLAGAYAYRDTRIGPLFASQSGCARPRWCAHEERGHARPRWLAGEAERLRSPTVACTLGGAAALARRGQRGSRSDGVHGKACGRSRLWWPSREAERLRSPAAACARCRAVVLACAGLPRA
jgi:hypothetical protein